MVGNLVGVVLVVTCAWGGGLHETRLGGGGSRHKARPAGRRARYELADPAISVRDAS